MFDLNFKENLKEVIKDEVSTVIDNQVDKVLDNEPAMITEQSIEKRPLHTDKYEELVELIKEESKKHVVAHNQKGENLFSVKSVVTILAFLVTSTLVQLDVALADGKISSREKVQLAITIIGAISTVAARGSEGDTGVFTPHGLPGLDKEFYDLNNNGIDDSLE